MPKIVRSCLTTVDNPFDPFDEFDKWYAWDISNGYDTCSYLARIANVTSELGPYEYNDEINKAIDEAVKFNFNGKLKKVSREYEI